MLARLTQIGRRILDVATQLGTEQKARNDVLVRRRATHHSLVGNGGCKITVNGLCRVVCDLYVKRYFLALVIDGSSRFQLGCELLRGVAEDQSLAENIVGRIVENSHLRHTLQQHIFGNHKTIGNRIGHIDQCTARVHQRT